MSDHQEVVQRVESLLVALSGLSNDIAIHSICLGHDRAWMIELDFAGFCRAFAGLEVTVNHHPDDGRGDVVRESDAGIRFCACYQYEIERPPHFVQGSAVLPVVPDPSIRVHELMK